MVGSRFSLFGENFLASEIELCVMAGWEEPDLTWELGFWRYSLLLLAWYQNLQLWREILLHKLEHALMLYIVFTKDM